MTQIPVIQNPEMVNPQDLTAKTNLLGMSRADLGDFFANLGEKPFRATQVMKWIYQFGVTDFYQMTNLSKKLQETLDEVATISPPTVKFKQFSEDGTRKWVFEVAGGSLVETVLIPADDNKQFGRKTLCISSQVGCALDCSFCSTGKQGFERDLSPSEIIGQLWVANQSYMENVPVTERENRVTNVVMMGMGEPLLNYEPVVASMSLMLDDFGFGLSKRRVTLSTSGIVPKMYELAKDIDVALAISLHAPNDELRNELVPINKKYPLKELIAAAKSYVYDENPRHKKHVTIEYVMLKDVNDTDEHARPHAPYGRSSNNRIHAFSNILNQAGFVCTIRQTRGDDIDAACGQLVGQVTDKTRRAKQWQEKVSKTLQSKASH